MNKESDSKRIVVLLENDVMVGHFPADCLADMVREWVANSPEGVSRDFQEIGQFPMRELLDASKA